MKTLTLILILTLAGCAITSETKDPLAYKAITPGSVLQLNKALTILPNSASVKLQAGRIVSKSSIDRNVPNCSLRSYALLDKNQIIEPDSFVVLRIKRESEYVQSKPLTLAYKMPGDLRFPDLDTPIAEIFSMSIYLQSDKNPDIKRLDCTVWRDPNWGNHISITELQNVLGGIVTIKIKK